MYPKLISLLLREHWAIDPSYALAAQPVLTALLANKEANLDQFAGENFMTAFVTPNGGTLYFDPESDDMKDQELPEGTVALIGVSGVMQKFGGLCSFGTEEISGMLSAALATDNVAGAVLRFHSPGGTVNSVIPLKRAMAAREKPVVTLVDSMAGSAAYYVASMGDVVMAVDALAEVGSIGAMATIINDTKRREQQGLELIKIYAPQSQWKNKPVEDALAGNTDTYANELLAPIAQNFIDHVKAQRKGKLDEDKEGVLSGKLFFAEAALKAGLIDEIAGLDEAISQVRKLALRNSIVQTIT